MSIFIPQERSYELVPAGSHLGICFRVVDLGTQSGQFGPRAQILFSWELPDELMADGRPFTINRRYGLSSSRKANLRADIEGWLGRTLTSSDFGQFDLTTLLGTTCMIGVKHETRDDGRTFANVTSVMKRPKAIAERMSPTNEAVGFSLAERPFRQYEYGLLPQWVQDAIACSPEYTAANVVSALPLSTQRQLKAILTGEPKPKPAPELKPLADDLDDALPF